MPKVQLDIDIDSHGNIQGIERTNSALDTLGRSGSVAKDRLAAASRGADQLATQGMVAGGAMLYLGGRAIGAASDVEEMRGKFSVVFGDQAAQVTAWSEEQAGALQRSKYDLQGYASTFQDTFVPMGFARDDAAGLSKQLATLGVDMASFNNTSDTEAIESLQSALVGNHETMRKYGVVITEATLGNKLMEMGIDGGTRAATEQQKVQARLALILDGTKDAQGDAARTSESYANQMRGLQSTVHDAQVEIGGALIPVLKDVIPPLAETVKNAAEFVSTPFGQTVAKAAIALSGMAVFGGAAYKAVGVLKSTIDAGKAVIAWLGSMSKKNAGALDIETAALERNSIAHGQNAAAAQGSAAARGTGGAAAGAGAAVGAGAAAAANSASRAATAAETAATAATRTSYAARAASAAGGTAAATGAGYRISARTGARVATQGGRAVRAGEAATQATGIGAKAARGAGPIGTALYLGSIVNEIGGRVPNNAELTAQVGAKRAFRGSAATGSAVAGANATPKVDVTVKIDGSGDEVAAAIANNATMTTKMEQIAGDETYKANRR